MATNDAAVAALIPPLPFCQHDRQEVRSSMVCPDCGISIPVARANSTDAAIAAVEAVLPKGWWLASMVQHEQGDWCVIASGQDDYLEADADTPAAALYALRDALARQQEGKYESA